jgi:ribokinase
MSGVVVLGSLNIDLTLETDRPARPGETREGRRFFTTPGGKGGNQAVAAARILDGRRPVTMVGRVGRDSHGDELPASLVAAGVGTVYVRRDGANHTGVAVIIVGAEGEAHWRTRQDSRVRLWR